MGLENGQDQSPALRMSWTLMHGSLHFCDESIKKATKNDLRFCPMQRESPLAAVCAAVPTRIMPKAGPQLAPAGRDAQAGLPLTCTKC